MNTTATANNSFTAEQVKAIRAELVKLRPANPVRADGKMTIKDVILQLAPTLAKMKAKGFTNAELAEHLGTKGIVIKAATLGKYINSALKIGKAPARQEQTQATPVPPEPVELI